MATDLLPLPARAGDPDCSTKSCVPVSDILVGFTRRQVLRTACVSTSQLERWDQNGIVSPQGPRGKRLYTADRLFGVLLIHELRERKFALQTCHRIWKLIERRERDGRETKTRWMLTNGETSHFLHDADVVLRFLEQRRDPAFVLISLEAIADKVAEAHIRFRKIRPAPVKRAPLVETRPVVREVVAERREQWA